MATQQGQPYDRGFREAVLGECFVQTSVDRFGEGAPQVIRQREADYLNHNENDTLAQGVPVGQIVTGADEDTTGRQPPSLDRKIPKTPYFRNNLTALSQKYNLYFAAYENRIFVYCPRGILKQALPREPNLILATKPDKIARWIGGTIDRRFFHQANHIATGFLGREEVLVSAYDDGSVFAYYTRHIADYIERTSSGCRYPVSVPSYFFRESVGISAWGIAIHQKSRLIAISSNRLEVTVFAFGLSRLPEAMECRERPVDYCERSVLKRKRNWRIVIPLGEGGHNIPNISLWDDHEGFAEKVVANDIYGHTWILDIWRVGTAPVKIQHRAHIPGRWHFHNPMGWSVTVLPYESFLPAHSVTDLLGIEESDIMNAKRPHTGRWIETQRGLARIRDHPAQPVAHRVPDPEVFGPHHLPFGDPIPIAQIAAQTDLWEAMVTGQPLLALPAPPPGDDDGNDAANAAAPTAAPAQNAVVFVPDHDFDEWSDGEEDIVPLDSGGSSGSDGEAGNDDNGQSEGENTGDGGMEGDGDESSVDLVGSEISTVDANAGPGIVFIEEALIAPDDDANSDDGPIFLETMTQVLPPDGTLSFFKSTPNYDLSGFQSSWLDMVYTPHDGRTYIPPTSFAGRLAFLRRPTVKNRNTKEQDSHVLEELGSRCCILRTYEEDIEMRSINPDDGAVVFCKDPIRWNFPQHPLLQHAERLNMVIPVPELSLVVIGSAIGRVILLTPTRSRRMVQGKGFSLKQGFRIDWVLPTLSDDRAGRRPPRGLYGVAVGPVQQGGASGCRLRAEGSSAPSPASKRYRLMLHYRDHSILSYEIGRDDKNEHILIF
ncbi:hypothetical protein CCHL11_08675 [Colletotrichum chlorophyti]|uniref:Uncharacterized protein n=1 Tax=Colletotrichum chlorophyti TaxID=708187 RepID=A0A1Q8RCI6_9PEZI|nr:hypothetical protein CCHL11_08675 [Colletotrichum chlorophyti]